MKTAHDYLRPYVGPEPGPYLAYADAVKAVQAALAEMHNAMQDAWVSCQQMEGKPLADERDEARRLGRNEMRARLLTMLPRPAELAAGPGPRPNVFPPACPRCTQRPDQCICSPLFPDTPPIRLGQLPAPSQAGSWCWQCRAAPESCECEQPPF